MKYQFTDKELSHIEKIKDDLIIELFDTKDKRFAIERAIKTAYVMGKEQNTEVRLR